MSDESDGVKVTDKRKIDPETGALREGAGQDVDASVEEQVEIMEEEGGIVDAPADPVAELTDLLQRNQAEFANYRKRVDRDTEVRRLQVVANTLTELLPILDDVDRARAHGELEGGFKSVGDALESLVARMGLAKYGEPGDEFDPMRHEAIAHEHSDDVTVSTCIAVFQSGYEHAGKVLRAAIVSVADPN
jgi:molecular chaperone GrpE